ncbi:ABC transporter permease [Hoeflea sp.]|uniref:ABC transporter permease n=1 Tax=Hoeflea sp. TaxID=1940281 RepID=UPI003B0245D6
MEVLSTYLNLLPVSLAQGAVYAFVALGVMIPFRVLSLPDLTSEGTFPLGGAVLATLLAAGFNPVAGLLVAIGAGVLAGGATALIHLLLKIPSLLAGIIVLTMLFSINIRIMGKPNTAIFNYDTIFTDLLNADGGAPLSQFALLMVIIFGVCGLLFWFLHTEIGVALRSVGANQMMSRAQGLPTNWYIVGGLGLAGALSAFGGAIMAQFQSYADVTMGAGVLIIGLAATILGEALVGTKNLVRQIAAPVVGALVYFQVVAVALALGMEPSDLRLLTGIFVLCTLAAPLIAKRVARMR